MKDYDAETFGELNAEHYDEEHDPGTTDLAIQFLYPYASTGKSLELAIGTGRIALPLSQRGCEIHGIDASQSMLDGLKQKPGGGNIPLSVADMADFKLPDKFDFAYLVFNTLFNLTSQTAQVACFENTAAHLLPGGSFLIETIVPDLSLFQQRQYIRTRDIDIAGVDLEAATHDPVTQVIEFQRVRLSRDGVKVKPLPFRYAFPPEIDLMAQVSGLSLVDRWGGWHKEPFTADSKMHISVYQKQP